MSVKRNYKITLTTEQINFEKENRKMPAPVMAKIFGIPKGTMSYNRWVIIQKEKPATPKGFFDLQKYIDEIVTI